MRKPLWRLASTSACTSIWRGFRYSTSMQIRLIDEPSRMAREAADDGASALRLALAERGEATAVMATGVSQFGMLEVLVRAPDIDWARVTLFHLDEYIGLPSSHPASFRRYLRERFLAHLPVQPCFIAIDGDAPVLAGELARLNGLLEGRQVDLCFAGIGENGHLAFNDPPADFDACESYLAVPLDEACRQQQLGEGWFGTLSDVPVRAISMSIRQIMRSQRLLLSAAGRRKADALCRAIEGPVAPSCPASIIQHHPQCTVYLDSAAASCLRHSLLQAHPT